MRGVFEAMRLKLSEKVPKMPTSPSTELDTDPTQQKSTHDVIRLRISRCGPYPESARCAPDVTTCP